MISTGFNGFETRSLNNVNYDFLSPFDVRFVDFILIKKDLSVFAEESKKPFSFSMYGLSFS